MAKSGDDVVAGDPAVMGTANTTTGLGAQINVSLPRPSLSRPCRRGPDGVGAGGLITHGFAPCRRQVALSMATVSSLDGSHGVAIVVERPPEVSYHRSRRTFTDVFVEFRQANLEFFIDLDSVFESDPRDLAGNLVTWHGPVIREWRTTRTGRSIPVLVCREVLNTDFIT